MRRTIFSLLLPSSVAGLVLLATPVVAQALDGKRQSELAYLVRQDCGSCHGMTLKGGLGGSLLPDALADLSNEGIASIILDGISGKPMPPWQGLLSKDEALWIADKLKTGFPQ